MGGFGPVAKMQFRLLRKDPFYLLMMFGMPLVIMPIFLDTMGLALAADGYSGSSGAEQVVAGLAVLFSFFVAGSVGFSVFREHGWKTWDRLRVSGIGPWAMFFGFAVPWILVLIVYESCLMAVGTVVFDLDLGVADVPKLLLVMFGYASCIVAIALLAATTLRTANQVAAFTNVGALVLGGIGGALVPIDQLPGWAQAIAPITPTYWAMRGFNEVLLESGGMSDVLLSTVVLLASALVLAVLASFRFRADETKEFFA